MKKEHHKRISKFMSLVLRHQPQTADLKPDEAGWVSVEDLLRGMAANRRQITRDQLEAVVRKNDKQRFGFDRTGTRIRATQGHSIDVSLGYEPQTPPVFLYHTGTVR